MKKPKKTQLNKDIIHVGTIRKTKVFLPQRVLFGHHLLSDAVATLILWATSCPSFDGFFLFPFVSTPGASMNLVVLFCNHQLSSMLLEDVAFWGSPTSTSFWCA